MISQCTDLVCVYLTEGKRQIPPYSGWKTIDRSIDCLERISIRECENITKVYVITQCESLTANHKGHGQALFLKKLEHLRDSPTRERISRYATLASRNSTVFQNTFTSETSAVITPSPLISDMSSSLFNYSVTAALRDFSLGNGGHNRG